GHKQGDEFNLSAHDSDNLCGLFYHDIFPYILMLQSGGSFPAEWGDQDKLELDCMDKTNCATIELKRIKE
ncbi:MAG: TIGR04076 family protein, partial [Desulfohalobiaceae bacterium]|nr:TIGR04076 family protein [Desulfohalobiaceae bacterium]